MSARRGPARVLLVLGLGLAAACGVDYSVSTGASTSAGPTGGPETVGSAAAGTCGTGSGSGTSETGMTCPIEQTLCGDACVDLLVDPLHCGACEGACAGDELCLGGACREATIAECDACPCDACDERTCCDDLIRGAIVCVSDDNCDGH